jgi:hypothetical protein
MDLLQGKTKWQPTWTKLPWDTKVMRGIVDQPVQEREIPLRLGKTGWGRRKAVGAGGGMAEGSLPVKEEARVEARR